ncbi:MAG: hypothetical protein AAGF47_08780, partial [Planctomycetota bacterium]
MGGASAHDEGRRTAERPRVVLAHDWLVGRRGGELVLEAMLEALEPAHEVAAILTMFDSGVPIARRIDDASRLVSPLNR